MLKLNACLASDFSESVGIELSRETVQIAVLEIDREYILLQPFNIVDDEAVAVAVPSHQLVLLALELEQVYEHLYKLLRLVRMKTVLGLLVNAVFSLRQHRLVAWTFILSPGSRHDVHFI